MSHETCCVCVCVLLVEQVQTENNGVNWVAVASWLCQQLERWRKSVIESQARRGGRMRDGEELAWNRVMMING